MKNANLDTFTTGPSMEYIPEFMADHAGLIFVQIMLH